LTIFVASGTGNCRIRSDTTSAAKKILDQNMPKRLCLRKPPLQIGDVQGHGLVQNRATGLRHVLAPRNSTIPLLAGVFAQLPINRFFIPRPAWLCPVIGVLGDIASHELRVQSLR